MLDETTGVIMPSTDENIKFGKELTDEKVSIHGETYNEIPEWIGQQHPNIKEMTISTSGLTYDLTKLSTNLFLNSK
jgi:hypothetical protein